MFKILNSKFCSCPRYECSELDGVVDGKVLDGWDCSGGGDSSGSDENGRDSNCSDQMVQILIQRSYKRHSAN